MKSEHIDFEMILKSASEEQLCDIIKSANNAYWIYNDPIFDDATYDQFVERLKELNPNNKLLFTIGGKQGTYIHKEPMLSLDKTYTFEGVLKWASKYARSNNEEFVLQPKYDGIAAKLVDDHIFTRGDGHKGQYIDHISTKLTIIAELDKGILHHNSTEKYLPQYMYGEIIIPDDKYNQYIISGIIKDKNGNNYKTPRSAVAGIINSQNIKDLPDDLLYYIPYHTLQRIYTFDELKNVETMDEMKDFIFGFKVPTDGMVFKLNDIAYQKSLGSTIHHPHGAIALKFKNVSNYGKVDYVSWEQTGKRFTPVLHLKEPVLISCVSIEKMTLHNYLTFKKWNPNNGDDVRIELAGGVIPKLVEIEHNVKLDAKAIDKCPMCGTTLIVNNKNLECPNNKCSSILIKNMLQAAKAFNIKGLGIKTCTSLVNNKIITELWQFVQFNTISMLSNVPGFTDESAELLHQRVNQAVGAITYREFIKAMPFIHNTERTIKEYERSIKDYPDFKTWITTKYTQDKITKEDYVYLTKMLEYFKPLSSEETTHV